MIIFYLLLIVLFGVVIPLSITYYHIYCIIVDFKGAPYVPTARKVSKEILAGAALKPGQTFIELGSGDGRVTRTAVKQYGVKGVGVDIHFPLIIYSRVISKLQHLKHIEFRVENLFKTDLSKYDTIFMFLLPVTLEKLADKLETNTKKGVLIISHGFKVKGFEKYLVKKQERRIFPTYFYQINSKS